MFGIFFKDKDTSFDNEYGMHILASISLSKYVEELHIPIDYWGITARNKHYYDPKNRNEQFYNLGNEQYRYPERFGVLFDAYGSSKVGNMLDDNEKSIKKYIGVE